MCSHSQMLLLMRILSNLSTLLQRTFKQILLICKNNMLSCDNIDKSGALLCFQIKVKFPEIDKEIKSELEQLAPQ